MAGRYEQLAPSAGILGTLFYHDPEAEQSASALRALEAEETPIAWPYGQPEAEACLKRMADYRESHSLHDIHKAYNRLFIGPTKLPAPPWGSVYTDPESVIFGNETLAIRRWMRSNCLKMNLRDKEPEDHFGLILLMLSWAATNDVSDESIDELLEQHLLPWAGRFLDVLIATCDNGFYEALSELARVTLADWEKRFDLHPALVRLSR